VDFKVGDFFKFKDEPFDIIYDPHFLCALSPQKRNDWVDKMKSLLKPNGILITLIFPIGDYSHGPPYAMQPQLMMDLLQPKGFEKIYLKFNEDSVEDRIGKEWVGVWKLKS